jgi:hypothetical protein
MLMLHLLRPLPPAPCHLPVQSCAHHYKGVMAAFRHPLYALDCIRPCSDVWCSYCLVHYAARVSCMILRDPAGLLTRGLAAAAGTVVKAPRMPPPPPSERTNRGRRLLQGGGLTGALAPGARASRWLVHR